MKPTAYRLLAISSAALLLLGNSAARTRPRYGETLRVETSVSASSYDAVPAPLVGLVYETLVAVDDNGRLHPGLATTWNSPNGGYRWELQLRSGVVFHDGSLLTAAAAVQVLQALPNQAWKVRDSSDGVIIESETPIADLPAQLSLPKYAITGPNTDGNVSGTGPYRIDQHTSDHFVLRTNDDYWGGPPFIDTLALTTGRAPHDQQNDFALDHADLVEIAPDQLRRAQLDHLRTDVSRPSETILLVIDSTRPELHDVRFRQALSLAIDRAAIQNVIFQHQAEVAGGLLPNWLTGYGFLFNTTQDLSRARQLRAELGQLGSYTLVYDGSDPVERLIAERVALNAHDAGINLQTAPAPSVTSDIRIRRSDLASLNPAVALNAVLDQFGILAPASSSSPESLYANERAAIQTYTAIPLVHFPRIAVMKDRVRNWTDSPDGKWHLENLWLARASASRPEIRP